MGIKIADMTKGDKVEKAKDLAAKVLKKKALGIGEVHDKPEGRDFALDLLDPMKNSEKLVTNLFIEILNKEYLQAFVDKAAKLASQRQLPKAVEQPLMACFSGVENREKLVEVVSNALFEDVKVYCADLNTGRDPANIKKRNETIAQCVKTIAQPPFIGCLLLFGSDHFDAEQSKEADPSVLEFTLCKLIPDMDWVKF